QGGPWPGRGAAGTETFGPAAEIAIMISAEAAMAAVASQPVRRVSPDEVARSAASGGTTPPNPPEAGWLRPCPRHSPNRPSAGHSGPTLDGTGSDGPRTARTLTPGARGYGRAAGASGVSCVDAGGY